MAGPPPPKASTLEGGVTGLSTQWSSLLLLVEKIERTQRNSSQFSEPAEHPDPVPARAESLSGILRIPFLTPVPEGTMSAARGHTPVHLTHCDKPLHTQVTPPSSQLGGLHRDPPLGSTLMGALGNLTVLSLSHCLIDNKNVTRRLGFYEASWDNLGITSKG